MIFAENDGDMDIHLTCENREICEKRKIVSVIYQIYPIAKRRKLLARFSDVH